MRVMVLGIRGLPNVQGGVETHAQHLYQRLVDHCDLEVLVRTPFVAREVTHAGPIRLRRIWAPRRAGVEALVHSLLGVLYAGIRRPDILHIHAIGPAIVTPLARLLGLRVVVTHHGPDYDREKWGLFARWVLRTGERFGMRYSNARIVISRVIADSVKAMYRADSDLIPNGVNPAPERPETEQVQGFGLSPGKYFLQVSRFVPEKRQLDLIRAYAKRAPPQWKLALVGGLDDGEYARRVKEEAQAAGVILTGFQSGVALEQLYSHAGGFVLPSSHEGLPIAMLEALSYGLPVLASDIPANLEVALDDSSYFRLGDVDALAAGLARLAQADRSEPARAARKERIRQSYDWERIAQRTRRVYQRVLPAP